MASCPKCKGRTSRAPLTLRSIQRKQFLKFSLKLGIHQDLILCKCPGNHWTDWQRINPLKCPCGESFSKLTEDNRILTIKSSILFCCPVKECQHKTDITSLTSIGFFLCLKCLHRPKFLSSATFCLNPLTWDPSFGELKLQGLP